MKYIVANWKSNKTTAESIEWLLGLNNAYGALDISDKKVIVCPSFTALPSMKAFIAQKGLSIYLGSQDVSPFDEGAYTGEINVKQVKELAEFSIVGHSERRKYFHESNDDVIEEVKRLLAENLTPILCISDMQQLDYYLTNGAVIIDNSDKIIFVYEPPSAISGGGAFHPEDPETANRNATQISQKIGKRVVTLYGGSLNADNAASFFAQENIDGGLIGQASLDCDSFLRMIESA